MSATPHLDMPTRRRRVLRLIALIVLGTFLALALTIIGGITSHQ